MKMSDEVIRIEGNGKEIIGLLGEMGMKGADTFFEVEEDKAFAYSISKSTATFLITNCEKDGDERPVFKGKGQFCIEGKGSILTQLLQLVSNEKAIVEIKTKGGFGEMAKIIGESSEWDNIPLLAKSVATSGLKKFQKARTLCESKEIEASGNKIKFDKNAVIEISELQAVSAADILGIEFVVIDTSGKLIFGGKKGDVGGKKDITINSSDEFSITISREIGDAISMLDDKVEIYTSGLPKTPAIVEGKRDGVVPYNRSFVLSTGGN